MKNLFTTYKQSILLLGGIIIGGLLGVLCPSVTPYIKPLGDVFMNLLFMLIVPLVLFSVSSSVTNLSRRNMLGKTLGSSVAVWLVFMLLAGFVTYLSALIVSPVDTASSFASDLMTGSGDVELHSLGDMIVGALTVTDFADLLSTKHVLPMMVFAALIGWAAAKQEGDSISNFLNKGNDLIAKVLDGLMFFAPIGLGCYFASMAADMGGMLLAGYGRILLIYVVLTAIFVCLFNPLVAWLSVGSKNMRNYMGAIIPPSITAISTCSSSATMPHNIQAVKKLGVAEEVADSAIPIGTQVFKLGSVVSSVQKIIFALLLSGMAIDSPSMALMIIAMSILASVVVGAVPTGAGTAELLICSMLGVDPKMLGVLIVISTIVDLPATLLNVNANSTATLLIGRLTGRNKK